MVHQLVVDQDATPPPPRWRTPPTIFLISHVGNTSLAAARGFSPLGSTRTVLTAADIKISSGPEGEFNPPQTPGFDPGYPGEDASAKLAPFFFIIIISLHVYLKNYTYV
jgi:hypothetical protein